MKLSWAIGLVMLFVLLTMISSVIETKTIGENEIGLLQSLMEAPVIDFTNPLGAVYSVMTVAWDYLDTFWKILWFDYAFFQGWWLIVKYILFIPVSVGFVVGLIFMLRGVGSD